MESKNNCGGLNESLKPSEERVRQAKAVNNLYKRCFDILKGVRKMQGDFCKNNIDERCDYFQAIHDSVKAFCDEFSYMRAQGLKYPDGLQESIEELEEDIGDLEGSIDDANGWVTLYYFSSVREGILYIQRGLVYMRAQQLAEENRRLRVENARQRRKQRARQTSKADKQRKREISQIRREAVNKRWNKERANAEASTPTESYKAANAVSTQNQIIVPCTARKAATESGKKALQKTYRPTHAQVAAFMHNRLKVRESVAEEQAEKFLNYYDAIGWEFGNTPVVSWEGVARSWVERVEEYDDFDLYEPQAPKEQQRPQEKQRPKEQAPKEPQKEEAYREEEERRQEEEARRAERAEENRQIIYYSNFFMNHTGIGGKDADIIFQMIETENFPNNATGRIAKGVRDRIEQETESRTRRQPQPLNGIVNKALRNMGAQT